MATTQTTTCKLTGRPQVMVDRPSEHDMALTLLGLEGIFWALRVIALEGVGLDTYGKEAHQRGIDCLITAGEGLCEINKRT